VVEKVAVVGAGLMGQWHSHFAKRCGAEIDAIVDVDQSRARVLADKFGCASTYSDVESMLSQSRAEVIHICTPTAAHLQLVEICIARGRHVLVEKPLVSDVKATRALLSSAQVQGLLLNPVHQFPFQRGFLELQERLDSVGAFVELQFLTCSAGGDGKLGQARRDVMLEILPHPISLLFRLFRGQLPAEAFKVIGWTEDDLHLIAEQASTTISIVISLRGRPTRNQLNLIGTAGTAHLDLFHGFALFEQGQVSRAAKILKPLKFGAGMLVKAGTNLAVRAAAEEPAYPGLRQLIARFYAAVKNKTAAPISDAEIISAAELMEIVRSAF